MSAQPAPADLPVAPQDGQARRGSLQADAGQGAQLQPPQSRRQHAAPPQQPAPGRQPAGGQLSRPALPVLEAGSRPAAQPRIVSPGAAAAQPDTAAAAPSSGRPAVGLRPAGLFCSPLLASAAAAWQPDGRGAKRAEASAPASPPPPPAKRTQVLAIRRLLMCSLDCWRPCRGAHKRILVLCRITPFRLAGMSQTMTHFSLTSECNLCTGVGRFYLQAPLLQLAAACCRDSDCAAVSAAAAGAAAHVVAATNATAGLAPC